MTLTREQVRRIDGLAVERFGIAGIVLMENAGRNAAEIIRGEFGTAGSAWICCGVGNNGGDGCVIARHLRNAGWSVRVLVAGDTARCTPDMKSNLDTVRAMNLELTVATEADAQLVALRSVQSGDIIVDALLGTGFRGEVRDPAARLIKAINMADKRGTVAVDVPSGLDCDTGSASNATIRADLTVTFVASKVGFELPSAAPFVGRVEVADIGVPCELITEVGRERI